MTVVAGTAGYETSIERFIDLSKALCFEQVCKDFMPFLPSRPAMVLDAGAGIGQNAAALAKLGHQVVAVEPMADFLAAAKRLYPAPEVRWLSGSLPYLRCLPEASELFDFVLIDGVLHHLSPEEQDDALRLVYQLLEDGGRCAISLRNGPAGLGHCVYPTDLQRTTQLAVDLGMSVLFSIDGQASIYAYKSEVSWARIVLQK